MKKFLCTFLTLGFLFSSVSFAQPLEEQYYVNGQAVENPGDFDFFMDFDYFYPIDFVPINPEDVKMPTYTTEQERLANLAHDSANYYEAKYRKPEDPVLANKIVEKMEQIKDEKTAKANMTTIKIPVWQIGKGGKKYTTSLSLTVLNDIAPEVKAIFTEIYNGKEKFPIHSIGGYAWRGGVGYHAKGLAIDINPTYNPQFKEDGVTPIVGSFYDPKKYPQSIGPDSDVVKAFGKRGWTWGAKFSKPDIMHFSYLEW